MLLTVIAKRRKELSFTLYRFVWKTVFNQFQMESFLEEWERVRDRAHDESQQDAAESQKHGRSLSGGSHLYLKFVGN
jgi:hypothetical protein